MTGPTGRMLTLLSLLQSRRDWPGGLLAERLDISHRTVRRDIERLRDLGYRIHATKGPDGGYQLEAGSELPPLLFDDEQAVALAVALQLATASNAGIQEAAARALTTVRQLMPARLRHRIDAVDVVAMRASGLTPTAPVAADTLVALSTAIRDRQTLRFEYGDAVSGDADVDHASARLRHLEPAHLVSRSGRWYAVGWDPDRDDWRILRVDRMRLRSHTGGRFVAREVPGGDARAFVGARFKGSAEQDRWPCIGTAVLRCEARTIEPFIGDGAVEDLGDGRCRVTSGSWSWRALAAQLGRFDADVETVSPPELAQAFADLAVRFAAVTPH